MSRKKEDMEEELSAEKLEEVRAKAQAVDEEARRLLELDRAGLCRLHKKELHLFRLSVTEPLRGRILAGDLSLGKLYADCLKILHESERKAWGFVEDDSEGAEEITVDLGF